MANTKLAIVVPSLSEEGGVSTVAKFLADTATAAPEFAVSIHSLATSATDPNSSKIARPWTWLKNPTASSTLWNEYQITHYGARFVELEMQRYRGRELLSRQLREADVIQVVAGIPSWAHPVLHLGRPVSLQVATLSAWERESLLRGRSGLKTMIRRIMCEQTQSSDSIALRSVDAIQVENRRLFDHVRAIRGGTDYILENCPPAINERDFPFVDRSCRTDPILLCVGRLADPRKNPVLLIEGFLLALKCMPELRLITAGASPPPREYWERITSAGAEKNVSHICTPTKKELISLYCAADIFALTSNEEGFGLVLLEAMSTGLPVISTRCGGPEEIVSDGIDGLLTPVGDPAALATAILRLATSRPLRLEMGSRARCAIDGKFSNAACGARFIDIWRRLAAGTRS